MEKNIVSIFIINPCIFYLFAVVFQSFLSTAVARELSGTLASMTISSDENPIIIEDNITIPPNAHFIVRKGCVLFFKPNTGIMVEGSLSIEGTKSNPVIFTSISDSLFPEKNGQKANPIYWNGIIINNHPHVIIFKNFILKYSIYGIESFNSNMIVENGLFIGNDQFNFTLNNKIMPVIESLSYNFKNEKGVVLEKDQSSNAIWLLPSAKAAIIASGAAFCFTAYYLHQNNEYVSLYSTAQSQVMRNDYFEKQKPLSRNAIISSVAGGAMLFTGGLLYVVGHNQKKKKNISLRPILSGEQGIAATIEF